MSTLLSELSNALAGAVEKAGRSVVRVEGRRRLAASGFVWRDEGVIVTANHVVRRSEGVLVALPDGKALDAAVVGRDPSTDIAVLKVEETELTPVEIDDDPKVGQLVLALGRPGQSTQATLGIVSALSRDPWRTAMGGQVDRYLQTDVVMYPGFSGGPLVNSEGKVLALNSSALVRGVSVAVPVTTLGSIVNMLLTHGSVQRGFLGVSTQAARLPSAAAESLGQESGLLVVAVEADSPAEEAGLVLGDTIVAMDGERVRQHDDLLRLLSGDRIGRKVPLRLLRGGEERTLTVTVGAREQQERPRRERRHGAGNAR